MKANNYNTVVTCKEIEVLNDVVKRCPYECVKLTEDSYGFMDNETGSVREYFCDTLGYECSNYEMFDFEYFEESQNVLVTSETALMLEELGFNQPCEFFYYKVGKPCKEPEFSRNNPMYMCECPTLENACAWLEKKYGIIIKLQKDCNLYYVIADDMEQGTIYDSKHEGVYFENVAKAIEKGVQESLALLY